MQTRWNFHSRIVSTVFEHKDDLRKCFELIIITWKRDQVSVCEASGLLHCFRIETFNLSEIVPSVDAACRYSICSTANVLGLFHIQTCLKNFVKSINNVREKIPDIFNNPSCTMNEEPLAKRPRPSSIDEETSLILKEVGDIIISHCCSQFEFTGHLVTATLFDSGSFSSFEQCFPTKVVEVAAKSFPFLDESKLCSELSVIYNRPEFRQCCGAVPLL